MADGWIVTHEDAVPGQALKAFVCDGCAVAEARRTRAHAAHGRQRCARCRRRRPEAESAVLEQVDDVTGDAFRVPLCRACADTELARLRDTMTSGV
ncbi:hypothetical protein [Egicoccus sp. AB-alg2]|uniref:hypothetical protein n=1 Tax=Egicoccus sp. AB-alg2 TaxID=3242693 RepID=UPI00359D02A8